MFGIPATDRFIFIGGEPSSNPPSGHYFLYMNGATGLSSRDDAGNVKTYRQSPSATSDNAVARFDGLTGNFQNSEAFITDLGRFGLGTSAPSTRLHTYIATGNVEARTQSDDGAAYMRTVASGSNWSLFRPENGNRGWDIGLKDFDSGEGFVFHDRTAGEDRFGITAAGLIIMPSLPSSDPGVSGAIYYDPSDSNRLKYSP